MARVYGYGITFVAGLTACLVSFGYGWGFVPGDDLLKTISDAALGLSGIVTAVVGFLLTLFVTQNLGTHPRRNAYRSLIVGLILSTALGFATSLAGFAVLEGASEQLRTIVPYMLLTVVYTIVFSLSVAAIEILEGTVEDAADNGVG